MIKRNLFALCTVTAAAAATVLASPAFAQAPASPDMAAALQRDLGITSEQAVTLQANESTAATTQQRLSSLVAAGFGGAYFDQGSQRLVVGVTDTASALVVRANGAEPRLVTRTEAALDTLKSELDTRKNAAPEGVHGWYVDVRTNTVTVEANPAATEQARAFAATLPADSVRIVASAEQARPLANVVGGQAYYINGNTRCSVGFSVQGGFVTAGHCGDQGDRTTSPSGTVQGSSFPGNDYGWVKVGSGDTPVGAVKKGSGTVAVKGSQDAAIGASICRSGSTTGWRCGTIQARNSTVRYPEGTITGLIKTSACAEGGDSGGSAISGTQAQGVTSGGSGNCSSGGTTYFQPVNEILQTYGLRLLTS